MENKRNNSKKRQALLEALRATKEHPTAETLYNTLKPDFPELSLGTVYRNLSILVEDGEIITVGKVDGHERYDAYTAPHTHFVCRSCRRVMDMDMPDLVSNLFDELESSTGCRATGFALTINGFCRDCVN